MSDLLIDQNNDVVVSNGDLQIVRSDDAIAQDLQQTMQFWLGEWFLDTSKGIAYRQRILVKNPNLDVVQAELSNAALGVNGVTDLVSFLFGYTPGNRGLSATLEVKTTNGTVIKAQAQIGATVGG